MKKRFNYFYGDQAQRFAFYKHQKHFSKAANTKIYRRKQRFYMEFF